MEKRAEMFLHLRDGECAELLTWAALNRYPGIRISTDPQLNGMFVRYTDDDDTRRTHFKMRWQQNMIDTSVPSHPHLLFAKVTTGERGLSLSEVEVDDSPEGPAE